MEYTFVGSHPDSLASGRPLVFGDVVDDADLTPADERLKAQLVPVASSASTPPVASTVSASAASSSTSSTTESGS